MKRHHLSEGDNHRFANVWSESNRHSNQLDWESAKIRSDQSIDRYSSIATTCIEIPDTNENVMTLSMNAVRNGRVNTAPFRTGLIKLNIVQMTTPSCFWSFSVVKINQSREREKSRVVTLYWFVYWNFNWKKYWSSKLIEVQNHQKQWYSCTEVKQKKP